MRTSRFVVPAILAGLLTLVATQPAHALFVSEITDDSLFLRPGTKEYAVAEGRAGDRLGLGEKELKIWNSLPGSSALSETQFGWSGEVPFALTFDGTDLRFTVQGSTVNVDAAGLADGANSLVIRVRGETGNANPSRNGTARLADVVFNDNGVELFTIPEIVSSDGAIVYAFSGLNVGEGDWSLSGLAELTGGLRSSVAFQIKVGEFAVVPVPAALPLLLTGLAGLGLVGYRRKVTR